MAEEKYISQYSGEEIDAALTKLFAGETTRNAEFQAALAEWDASFEAKEDERDAANAAALEAADSIAALQTQVQYFKGAVSSLDSLNTTSSIGTYHYIGGGWKGLAFVGFDAMSNVCQVALSSSTPSYTGESLTWLSGKPCVMTRKYANGNWGHWATVSSGSDTPHPAESQDGSPSDLDISDENGFVLGRFVNGHFKTKNFDSSTVITTENSYTKTQVDALIPSDYYTKAQTYTKTEVNNLINSGGATPLTPTTRTIKILSVGNSYSADAFMYFPYVFRNVAPELDIIIGIASVGSCTMAMHYSYATGGNANYNYYKWTSSNGAWTSSSSKTLEYAVQDEYWDMVIFQQKSTDSANYSTISPYLTPIIKWLFAKVGRAVKVGWLMTPALPRGNSGLSGYGWSSDQFYASLVTTAQSILTDTPVSFVIPEGTAIQNCRKTSLNELGDYEYNYMVQDGVHLQQGLPCLAASYACVQYILDLIGYTNKGILGDTIRPTDALDTTWNIISQQGNCVGVTNANCMLAQMCVMMAMKKPYEITNCGTLFE